MIDWVLGKLVGVALGMHEELGVGLCVAVFKRVGVGLVVGVFVGVELGVVVGVAHRWCLCRRGGRCSRRHACWTPS